MNCYHCDIATHASLARHYTLVNSPGSYFKSIHKSAVCDIGLGFTNFFGNHEIITIVEPRWKNKHCIGTLQYWTCRLYTISQTKCVHICKHYILIFQTNKKLIQKKKEKKHENYGETCTRKIFMHTTNYIKKINY